VELWRVEVVLLMGWGGALREPVHYAHRHCRGYFNIGSADAGSFAVLRRRHGKASELVRNL